jgi:hypothetical protein
MNTIEEHLYDAINYINFERDKKEKERDTFVMLLDNDLIALDSMPRSEERKETIVAINNVLTQLENIFKKEKYSIRLQNSSNERTYLPKNRDSHYALGTSFRNN